MCLFILEQIIYFPFFGRCQEKTWQTDLPTTSIIICFHNEGRAALLRTVVRYINSFNVHLHMTVSYVFPSVLYFYKIFVIYTNVAERNYGIWCSLSAIILGLTV